MHVKLVTLPLEALYDVGWGFYSPLFSKGDMSCLFPKKGPKRSLTVNVQLFAITFATHAETGRHPVIFI